jgi:Divergent InlB B-repeat domain
VTLTATAAAGSTFTGWSGDCTGTGTCIVTMDQDRAATATFALIAHTLTVTKAGAGSGSVSSSPAGIDCGATCSASFAQGTVVTLTATAAAGSTFTGWSGDCTGTGTCIVTMDQDRAVTATFNLAGVVACTLSQGYWKTHSKYGPASKPDPTWNLLPGGLGPDTTFFYSGQTWIEVFKTSPRGGNAYYILAHQYMAARLNILNGASTTPAVDSALAWATSFFNNAANTPSSIGSLRSSDPLRQAAIGAAGTLGGYNEGTIGPCHCAE